jgi:hypothetical protein
MKIISYCICGRRTTDALENLVNQMIQERWEPLGAPYYNPKLECMEQAMVKYEKAVEVET